MPKFPNAHLVLNSRDRVLPGNSGSYNNFILRNPGQNIVQGAMKDVAFSETYFPYDIPNIQTGYNRFYLGVLGALGPTELIEITIAPGFYTGTELAAYIQQDISANAGDFGIPLTDIPTCSYDQVTNRFTFTSPASPATPAYGTWFYNSAFLNPAFVPQNDQRPDIGKDILTIMGYSRDNLSTITINGGPVTSFWSTPTTPFAGGSAPLTFTDYIDICSPALCQYQYLRDGSTTNFPRRVDLICRLYIADETSAIFAEPAGTRPFIIHRQFKNQRVMKNTAANAINDVDIQLYDDCGQPLQTTYAPRNYQITFHVYEADAREAESNIGYKF
jgi:hypothetical protein